MYSGTGKFPCSLGIINSKNELEMNLSVILFIRTQGNIDPVYFTFSPKNYATFAQS